MGSFRVRYTQEAELEGNAGPLQHLTPTVEAIYNKTAAVAGLLASLSQREAGKAMQVLTTLALYARPLVGDEFRLLHEHGLVSQADYGQLFSWLTKTGLADVLQISRPAVRAATTWLIEQQLIKAIEMPPAFIEQYVQRRGQFTADTVYVLSTNGALVTEFAPAREPGEVTVETELPRSTATVVTELPRSEASPWKLSCHTVATQLPQSITNTNSTDTDRTREISLLMPQIQAAWQAAWRSELSSENAQILAAMLTAGETHLPVLEGMLYLMAQRAAGNPPETQFALLVGILTGKTSLDWDAAPARAAETPSSESVAPAPDGLPTPAPALDFQTAGDPVLAQVAHWYEQEIETLSPFAADEIRDLTGRFRDVTAWKDAFTKAAAAKKGIARWAYIVKCMEGSDGKFRLDRKPKTPPGSAATARAEQSGATRASGGGPLARAQRGAGAKRTRLPVAEPTSTEAAALSAAITDAQLADRQATARAALSAAGLSLSRNPDSGNPGGHSSGRGTTDVDR